MLLTSGQRPEKDTETDKDTSQSVADGEVKCAERWKNAAPDQRKRMFALFEETGIFVTACRHRTILYICDMIKSGEL
jgi:hypothetical protein